MGDLTKWSDEELIKAFARRGALRESATTQIMTDFIHYVPTVAKKTGLDKNAALDAFTDAIMDLVDQVADGRFKGESKLSSYFYKIFYFKCIDLFRKNSTNKVDYQKELPEQTDKELSTARVMEIKEEMTDLERYLKLIGTPCRQILIDWGYWGYNMVEIAAIIGLKNSKQAKDRKYKCLQKLRKVMQLN